MHLELRRRPVVQKGQQWLLARALAAARWQVASGVTDEIAAERRCNIDGVDFIGIGHGYGHVFSAWYRFFVSERPDGVTGEAPIMCLDRQLK
jgi:hypothetical protein